MISAAGSKPPSPPTSTVALCPHCAPGGKPAMLPKPGWAGRGPLVSASQRPGMGDRGRVTGRSLFCSVPLGPRHWPLSADRTRGQMDPWSDPARPFLRSMGRGLWGCSPLTVYPPRPIASSQRKAHTRHSSRGRCWSGAAPTTCSSPPSPGPIRIWGRVQGPRTPPTWGSVAQDGKFRVWPPITAAVALCTGQSAPRNAHLTALPGWVTA